MAALSMHMIKIKHGSDIHEWKGNKNKQREMLFFFISYLTLYYSHKNIAPD